jgi:hypothetical protein
MKTLTGLYDIERLSSEEKKIIAYPAGKLSEIYSDISDKLLEDENGDVKILFNLEAVEAALDNIIGTIPGERVMRPTFAANLDNYLFSPITTQNAMLIENEVFRAIMEWYPPLKVNATVEPDPENSRYIIWVSYEVEGLGLVGELSRVLTFE